MKITSSGPKYYLKTSIKGLIASLGLKTIVRSNKNKKARYAINNVIMKDLSKIIKDFEKLPYDSYVRKRPKHETTESCFYLTRQLAKCMMRVYAFNSMRIAYSEPKYYLVYIMKGVDHLSGS